MPCFNNNIETLNNQLISGPFRIKDLFPSKNPEEEAKFDHSKRFPGKDSKSKIFPPLKTLRLPLKFFEKDEDVHETVEFKSEEDII
mgnify:CR=1 FL=1